MEFIPYLVLDCGSDSTRFGKAGEDNPQLILPSKAGVLQSSDPVLGTDELSKYTEGMAIKPFIGNDGFICDYDLFQQVFGQVYNKMLPDSKGVFMTEPPIHRKEHRVKLAELMFEKFGFNQMFMCKSPVLSSFSCGKSTCLVFDSGENNTYAVPVHDGYIIQSSIYSSKVAGDVLTEACNKYFKSQNVEVVPECMLKTVIKNGKMDKEKQDLPGFTESAQKYHVNKILKKMKHEVLTVSQESIAKMDSAYAFESKFYCLPDGSAVELKGEQFKIPEILFLSDPQQKEDAKNQDNEGDAEMLEDDSYNQKLEGFTGFQNLVQKAVNASDMDIRRDLYRNVLCTGGTTQMKNFEVRFKKELEDVVPQNTPVSIITKTKIPCPGMENNDFYTSWIGASILASLGSFKSMWFNKKEYDENGAYYIEKKCP